MAGGCSGTNLCNILINKSTKSKIFSACKKYLETLVCVLSVICDILRNPASCLVKKNCFNFNGKDELDGATCAEWSPVNPPQR